MTVLDGPLRVDSERTRREILRSARQLCREVGYEQIRMADIAKRVGCARATVYNHFASRDQLLEALCAEYLDGYLEIRARVRASVAPGSTVFEVLRETVAEELRWRTANDDLREALDSARMLRKEFYIKGDRAIDDAMLGWFGGIYGASAQQGLLHDGIDLGFATQTIYAMIDHVVAGFPVKTSAAQVTRAADQVARLQWHALYRSAPEQAPLFEALAVPEPA